VGNSHGAGAGDEFGGIPEGNGGSDCHEVDDEGNEKQTRRDNSIDRTGSHENSETIVILTFIEYKSKRGGKQTEKNRVHYPKGIII
jgi:hypothetical protein